MNIVLKQLKDGLVVSCQAEEDSPFNTPDGVGNFARCAEIGGANGIRSCGIEKTKYIIEHTQLPVIALTKSLFEDGFVKITGSFSDVNALINVNARFIAIDGTFRLRENLTGPQFIQEIKKLYPEVLIMADIATIEEAKACYNAGADCISTTLCGYTPDTVDNQDSHPPFSLLQKCVDILPKDFPIMAEGRFNTPEYAAEAIRYGAWAVIVGTSITRPQIITQWYVDAIKNR